MDMNIYAVQFEPGASKNHQTLAKFRWSDIANPGNSLDSTKARMVERIDTLGDKAWVLDGATWVPVVTVAGTPKYLRSKKDGVLTDNLVNLPTF